MTQKQGTAAVAVSFMCGGIAGWRDMNELEVGGLGRDRMQDVTGKISRGRRGMSSEPRMHGGSIAWQLIRRE
jgi:hypothetical protein